MVVLHITNLLLFFYNILLLVLSQLFRYINIVPEPLNQKLITIFSLVNLTNSQYLFMNNNTKKGTEDNQVKIPKSRWSPWFFGIIILALLVYALITYINFSEAKDYREKIISNQRESLSYAKQKIGAIYKLDSLITISQSRLDNANSDLLKSNRDSLLYINYIISHSEEFKRSSDALKQELDATAKETKSMIDIHLQYIDQQYSTLSLWAGIITIVFLIFSFYAVFKQEDAINKAYAIIDELNKKLFDLDESVKSKMRKIEEDSESLIKGIDVKVAQEIEIISQKSTDYINEIKDKSLIETNKIIQEADKQRKISQLTSEAEAYRKEEKYDLALEKINEAIRISEDNDYLFYLKGLILDDSKDYNLAIDCFKKAISLNKNLSGYYFILGYSFCHNEEYDLAIENFLIAINMDSKNSYYFAGLGYVYWLKKLYDLATQNFQISANLNNKNLTSYYFLGRINQELKDYKLSLFYFNKVLEIDATYSDVMGYIAEIYSDLNNISLAIDYYSKALKIKDEAYYHFKLGDLYIKRKEYISAISSFTKAIELEQSKILYYLERASVYSIINDNKNAIADYKRILEIEPENDTAKSKLSQLSKDD